MNPLENHLPGCTPASRCTNCEIADIFKETLGSDDYREIRELLKQIAAETNEESPVTLTAHLPSCTPAIPCAACDLYDILGEQEWGENKEKVFAFFGLSSKHSPDAEYPLLDDLELSIRACNVIRNHVLVYCPNEFPLGIETPLKYFLEQVSKEQLKQMPNCGRVTVAEIEEEIGKHNMKLRDK